MWDVLTHAFGSWSAVYADSATIRITLGFAHIAGLVVGGGAALSEDRAILTSAGYAVERRRTEVRLTQRGAHSIVIAGLTVVMASGFMLFAADYETYLHSAPFWIKMALVVALIGNGWALSRAELDFAAAQSSWPRLRRAAVLSVALWLFTTLAGAVLPNV